MTARLRRIAFASLAVFAACSGEDDLVEDETEQGEKDAEVVPGEGGPVE